MEGRPPSRSGPHLELPRKSVELHDPGARELESSDGEEYFSDASEGRRKISRPATPTSPIPITRVEKIDDLPSHGQLPGTPAYEQRLRDAVPDEIEVVPEGRLSKRGSRQFLDRPVSPGGTEIPRTVVEKVDPALPSHGDVPGTAAYDKRMADATPDLILKAPGPGQKSVLFDAATQQFQRPDVPIPETVITRVESQTGPVKVSGSDRRQHNWRKLSLNIDYIDGEEDEDEDGGFGDDFDDFEEGAQAGIDDDFGDFDESLHDPESPDVSSVQSPPLHEMTFPAFPLIDFEELSSIPDLIEATTSHLDAMFPYSTAEKLESLPLPEPIPLDSPIFPTERSRSLWKQLITPPPLQPPNWTKSRIRRLFLVSLGVPVDLDEILPPSKQKKLVLPDINLESSGLASEGDRPLGSIGRLKARAANGSSASVDSVQSGAKAGGRRRQKGALPPPELDLGAVKRLCATTNEKLDGFTDDELKAHVQELEGATAKTSELLEYWLKRRDGARKEKESFEGVIENLIRHHQRVRK